MTSVSGYHHGVEIVPKYWDRATAMSWSKWTSASYAPLPSSSDMSKSSSFDRCNLLTYRSTHVVEGSITEAKYCYHLQDLVKDIVATDSHTATYRKVVAWLETELQEEGELKIIANKLNVATANSEEVHCSSRQFPDIAIVTTTDTMLVQFEVHSGPDGQTGVDRTIRKLALEISQQLRDLRNRNDTITKCCGFYLPRDRGCVIKVSLEWSDAQLRFTVLRHYLQQNCVITAIKEVLAEEVARVAPLTEPELSFTLPVSREFIRTAFGAAAVQVKSGKSVVIVDPATKKVFKRPLDPNTDMLLGLIKKHDQVTRSALPIQYSTTTEHCFLSVRPIPRPIAAQRRCSCPTQARDVSQRSPHRAT